MGSPGRHFNDNRFRVNFSCSSTCPSSDGSGVNSLPFTERDAQFSRIVSYRGLPDFGSIPAGGLAILGIPVASAALLLGGCCSFDLFGGVSLFAEAGADIDSLFEDGCWAIRATETERIPTSAIHFTDEDMTARSLPGILFDNAKQLEEEGAKTFLFQLVTHEQPLTGVLR